MLRKAFKNVGTVIGEAIVAIAGLGTVYGLGWLSGCKSGTKLSEIMNRAMDDAEQQKKTEEVPADEPDKEQEEDKSNELPEVEFD